MPEPADEELAQLTRTGAVDTFGHLYARHWPAGLAFAKRLAGNTSDAEDIASEAFVKIIAALRAGKGPSGPFRPYLFRTIRSCAADHWSARDHQTRVMEIVPEPEEDPRLALLLEANDRALVVQAFVGLPARWQTVLWYLDVMEETPRTVAPLMGLKPNAVSSLATRARRGLRHAFLQAHLQAHPADPTDPGCEPPKRISLESR